MYPGIYDGVTIGKSLTLSDRGVHTFNTVLLRGHSPALTITSGSVSVSYATFTTATADPTILVSGGTLTMRNCVINESTGSDQYAIKVTGGPAIWVQL